VDVVKGLTGSVDGLEQLMNQSRELFPALLRLVAGENDTAEAALYSLINLSQVSLWCPQLLRASPYHISTNVILAMDTPTF
jgi:hypothetical protein